MRTWSNAFLVAFYFGVAVVLGSAAAHAQGIVPSIALKSGESSELTDVYWVSNCKSMLKGTPEVEILDGPKEVVTVAVKEAMVLPRLQNCAARVAGGKVVITAKEIDEPSYTRLTIRITLKGRDGNRQISQVLNLSLIP